MDNGEFEADFNRSQSKQWMEGLKTLESYTTEYKLPLSRQEYVLYRESLSKTYKDLLDSSSSKDITLTTLLDGEGEILPMFQQGRIVTFETAAGKLEPAMLITEVVAHKPIAYGYYASRPTLYDILFKDPEYLDTIFDYSDTSKNKNRKLQKYQKLLLKNLEQSTDNYYFALAPLSTSPSSSCQALTLKTENNTYYGDKDYLELFILPNNPTCKEDLLRLNLLVELLKYSSPEN